MTKAIRSSGGLKKCAALTMLAASLLWCAMPAGAEDIYPFPKIEDTNVKKPKEVKKPIDPFVRALSRRTAFAEKDLTETFEKGFGRTEVIRLVLIAQKSNKSFSDLVKEREKGTRLAKLAESAKLDNKTIRKQASVMLKELETDEIKIKEELAKSTTTTAGISEAVTKSSTNYLHLTPDATGQKKNRADE